MPQEKDRKLNRLSEYDYSQNGFYFITTCVNDRSHVFGCIHDGVMQLNKFGEIVKKQWLWLAEQYLYIKLDQSVVMPNHFHGIIIINNPIVGTGRDHDVGTGRDLSLPGKIKPIPELIGAFKTTSSKLIHQMGLTDFRWQRSYYDHIVRCDDDLERIRNYIINNPIKLIELGE
ncbi:MAG: hypothetical protein PHW53_00840 [Patescibacteria group bacterium]|nr:hypothetical protein [Patescibacteria group bacterium]